MPFHNQTHPAMAWEQSLIDKDSCLTTTYVSGPIAQVRIAHPYPFEQSAACDVEVLFRDGSQYKWQNKHVCTAYNSQFGISVSKDGRFLFVQTWDKGMFCYDAKSGAQVWRTKRRFGITNIFVNESTVLVHQHEKALQLLDIETGEVLKEKKPARDWGFHPLDDRHLICQTCAKHWEIIRAEDLETVEAIPAKKFPGDRWRVRNVYQEDGVIKYEAFCDGGMKDGKHICEIEHGIIETHYQEET